MKKMYIICPLQSTYIVMTFQWSRLFNWIITSLFSRALAEQSPYYESLKKRNVEVLFCYEPYDELVLMHLRQFKSYNLTSVEKEMRDDKEANKSENLRTYIG